jgi:hypothetical protein
VLQTRIVNPRLQHNRWKPDHLNALARAIHNPSELEICFAVYLTIPRSRSDTAERLNDFSRAVVFRKYSIGAALSVFWRRKSAMA